MSVGFAIPSIPPRAKLLARALLSIGKQTHPIDQISIAIDNVRAGAGPTRNRAKNAMATTFTCFLDDDDEVFPNHVQHLMAVQAETDADVVFPWFQVAGGSDPFPGHRGLEWNPQSPHIFPITVLARTEVIQSLDFEEPSELWEVAGEDWVFWCELGRLGAKVVHTPEITWRWHHNPPGGNTGGCPDRW